MKQDTSINLRDLQTKDLDFRHLRVAIVGGTNGIGRSLARSLASHGADVLVVGRTFRDGDIRNIVFLKADLSLLKEARRIAAELPAETLDIVMMTTGIMAGPKRQTTPEGIERDLAVSYLSRYVILDGIASRLGTARPKAAMKPRVFVLGYPGSGQSANVEDLNSETKYGRMAAHSNTVAGNEALVLDTAERYQQIDVFGLNPGFVKTGIRANVFGSKLLLSFIEALTSFMTIKPEVYAERVTPLLVATDVEGRSGAMFDNKPRAVLASENVAKPAYRRALMAASKTLVRKALANVGPTPVPTKSQPAARESGKPQENATMAKVLVLYYSAYGHIETMAEAVAEGVRDAGGTADIRRVPELVPEDIAKTYHFKLDQAAPIATVEELANYDAIVVGVGTRYGRMASQMANFLDQTGSLWMADALVGKVGAAFTSTGTQHGGQETTLFSIIANLMHFGMTIVGVDYKFKAMMGTDEVRGGSPYGATTISGGNGQRTVHEEEKDSARYLGRKVATIAAKLTV